MNNSATVSSSVILVEDDPSLCQSLCELLSLSGFEVAAVGSGLAYYQHLARRAFTVAIIDLGLPDQDGAVLVEYTRRNTESGVIVLTARDTSTTRITSYESGADLFFGKPVDGRELVAAVTSLARRHAPRAAVPAREAAAPRPWMLDCGRRKLIAPTGTIVGLTPMEMRFVALLAQNSDGPIPRSDFEEKLYGYASESSRHALDTLVRRVRRKIAAGTGAFPILTAHGVGYSFSEPLSIAL